MNICLIVDVLRNKLFLWQWYYFVPMILKFYKEILYMKQFVIYFISIN